MNADRRLTARVCVALLEECNQTGLISDESHDVISEAIKVLNTAEYWQIRNQERHEGRNASTDTQLAICRVAAPALEAALAAWNRDDFTEVIKQLTIAITTDGKPPAKPRRRKRRA